MTRLLSRENTTNCVDCTTKVGQHNRRLNWRWTKRRFEKVYRCSIKIKRRRNVVKCWNNIWTRFENGKSKKSKKIKILRSNERNERRELGFEVVVGRFYREFFDSFPSRNNTFREFRILVSFAVVENREKWNAYTVIRKRMIVAHPMPL